MISQSPRALPLYAFYSVVRIGLAYLLSLSLRSGMDIWRRTTSALKR